MAHMLYMGWAQGDCIIWVNLDVVLNTRHNSESSEQVPDFYQSCELSGTSPCYTFPSAAWPPHSYVDSLGRVGINSFSKLLFIALFAVVFNFST